MSEFVHVYRDDITDRHALGFWDILCAHGRAQTFFYDRENMTAEGFLRWFRQGELHPWITLFRGRPFALMALNGIKGKRAWGHFAFLPCGVTRTERRMSAQQGAVLSMLATWLYALGPDGEHPIDHVYGLTPETNRPAVHLVKRMSGNSITTLPGFCYVAELKKNVGGIVTMHSRETVPAEAREY